MSLFKQIYLLVTSLLIVMLAIVLNINFDNARDFAANQLYNSGKNVANVLALSLGSQTADKTLMETSINAMFDGGHFEEITLTQLDGAVVYKRSERIVIDGVPSFFLRHVDLPQPIAEAQVSHGWSIFGTIHVKGHPGSFIISLWETFKRLCILSFVLGGLALSVIFLILKFLLNSLEQIQHQAEAISNNEFIINSTVPKTPELRNVVLAMNAMVEKVQHIFRRQLDSIKYYQEMQFKDAQTKLHNREFFVKQLGHLLGCDNEKGYGQVFIIGLAGMEKRIISAGYPIIHSFYQSLAEILKQETQAVADAVTARLPRHEFAAILPNCSPEKGQGIADAIMKGLQQLIARVPQLSGLIVVNGGMAAYGYKDSVNTVLSKTDYALSSAKSGLPGTFESFQEKGDEAVLGKLEWKTMLDAALSDGRFFLSAQPVLSDTNEYHREIFINLKDTDAVTHRAGYFMPMVINLGMAGKIDRYVLECAAACLKENPDHIFAVNITTDFCKDRLAFSWLRQYLADNKPIKTRLVLEIHDSTLIQHPDICLDLSGMLKGMGYAFGIDQYSMNEVSLDLIKEMKPQYIKIDYDYLEDIDKQMNTVIALNAMLTITDSLGIELIASKIETEEQRLSLAAKNINYFQGLGIAGVAPLGN